MKKFLLALFALTVLAACNETAAPEAAAPAADSTVVADSCCAEVDTTVVEAVDSAK